MYKVCARISWVHDWPLLVLPSLTYPRTEEQLLCQMSCRPRTNTLAMRCGRRSPNADIVISLRTRCDLVLTAFSRKDFDNLHSACKRLWTSACNSQGLQRLGNWRRCVKLKKTKSLVTNQDATMCTHIACFCSVPIGEEYCCESCRDAGRDGVEVACQCDHLACPVTARQFMTSLVA